jgi:alkylated DNA repair dioxygenase AlkB
MDSTITLTLGDQAENHVGMQKIGIQATSGYSLKYLQLEKDKYEKLGCNCELVDLTRNAYILIIRDGVNKILNQINKTSDDLYNEQIDLDVDKKAYMYGRVVNKKARYNLCFSDFNQEPDYPNKKGRIIALDNVPLTKYIKEYLTEDNLQVEGNYYYDIDKCGIGFHGDAERRKVIGVRLGLTLPLHYQWFHKNKSVDDRIKLNLNHGDIYIMSEKAVGYDWKKSSIHTLRHAAGSKSFLEIKKK